MDPLPAASPRRTQRTIETMDSTRDQPEQRRCRARVPSASLMIAAALGVILAVAPGAAAQLREDQVLVVYDSRIADSLAVAEYYAGSARVPGGAGNLSGARPGVRVMDLAPLSPALLRNESDVSLADFAAYLRNPIRTHLSSNNLQFTIRCLCLTKGLPHRVRDFDQTMIGDNPPAAQVEFGAGDYSASCVDADLALLWQNLDAGEAGNPGDSKADGLFANPYFRSALGINSYLTRNMLAPKTISALAAPTGTSWRANSGLLSTQITPGDIYLVCRLDGNTVQNVRDMIDRSQNPVVNMNTAVALFDESNANGIADATDNGELDNQSFSGLRPLGVDGDDYESTANFLVADGRLLGFAQTPPPASPLGNVLYNRLTGADQFFVGPRVSFGGQGYLISGPVLLLATEGNNHGAIQAGFPVVPPGAGSAYPWSFNYAPGAVMTSIESANGRNFHGIGSNFGQASISDFLAAGGCFAIGHVWEPFAFTIPRNNLLARNFVLGSMTWVEAAYTAIPTLSFQTIVVGDPLARLTRSSEDTDGSGRVGVEDLVRWFAAPTDLNRSGAADATDARLVEQQLRLGEQAGMVGRQRVR